MRCGAGLTMSKGKRSTGFSVETIYDRAAKCDTLTSDHSIVEIQPTLSSNLNRYACPMMNIVCC